MRRVSESLPLSPATACQAHGTVRWNHEGSEWWRLSEAPGPGGPGAATAASPRAASDAARGPGDQVTVTLPPGTH
eukprot:766777-Hanusia_phi.AAC.1